jgi:hypothetical protein
MMGARVSGDGGEQRAGWSDDPLIELRVWDDSANAPDPGAVPEGHQLAIGARVEAHIEAETLGQVAAVLVVLTTIEADLLGKLVSDARVKPEILAGILSLMREELEDTNAKIADRLYGAAGVTS